MNYPSNANGADELIPRIQEALNDMQHPPMTSVWGGWSVPQPVYLHKLFSVRFSPSHYLRPFHSMIRANVTVVLGYADTSIVSAMYCRVADPPQCGPLHA
jgi:hypothetical protein